MSDTNKLTIETYNKSVDEYVKGSLDVVNGHIQTWLDKCIDGLDASARILEIGVGHGKDADYLETKGFSVERTDASSSFVDYQKNNGHDARILNILTDAIEGEYDMVLADAVWLHFTVEEAKQATVKVLNSLKDGGFFAFSVKEGNGDELTDRKLNSTRFFHYWQEDDIKSMLEDVGFKEIEITHAPDYRPDRPGWYMIIAKK